METKKFDIINDGKTSNYYPDIYQSIINNYDIGNIKEGIIVKYRVGTRKCVVVKVSSKEIIIDDITHTKFAKRVIKKDDIYKTLQLVVFLDTQCIWETTSFNSYHELKIGDYLVDSENNLYRIDSIYDKRLAEIFDEPDEEGRLCVENVKKELIYIRREQFSDYKKIINIKFI